MAIIKNPITVVQGGSTPSSPSDYGRLELYYWDSGWTFYDMSDCTAEITDESLFNDYMAYQNPLIDPSVQSFNFNYEDGIGWTSYSFENPIENWATEDIESNMGITVVLNEGAEYANFQCDYMNTVYTSGDSFIIELTQSMYNKLGNNENGLLDIGMMKIPSEAIKKFEFGTIPTTTPKGFLKNTNSLQELDFSNNGLTSIGDDFLYNSSMSFGLTIPNTITSIGRNFLYSCTNFDSILTLPSNLTSIGDYFMNYCFKFARSLTLPSNLSSIGEYFMYNCHGFHELNLGSLPASILSNSTGTDNYSLSRTDMSSSDGIVLNGTYAADWKTALPNRYMSPYRNLILGS